MAKHRLFTTLLAVVAVAGCQWGGKRDAKILDIMYQDNQWLEQQVRASTPIPAPPQVELSRVNSGVVPAPGFDVPASGFDSTPISMTLHEAIEIALAQSRVARVSLGDSVAASPNTFYDVEVSEEQLRAALASFDAQFASQIYTNEFKNPPDSIFGPGISQADQRDEAAITAGLTQPLIRGGSLSASYRPSPGYFFVPGSTGGGFNPRYISATEFIYRQPLMRNAGRQVNVAPLQVAQLAVEQSAWDFKVALIESVQSVVESYWELYAARVAVKEYENVLPVLAEIVRIQEESFQANLVIASDVAKARSQQYAYQQDYLRLQSEVLVLELRMKNLLNIAPSDSGVVRPITKPTTRPVATTPNESYYTAIESRPEIVQQRLNVRLRRLEVMVANNQQKPDFDFTALYRMNGLGENLGDALDQMVDAEFTDVELGFTLSMPVGLRQKKSETQAARFRYARDQRLLQQGMFSVSHEIAEAVQKIDFTYLIYEKATLRLRSSSQWVQGASLRYRNPAPDSSDNNWMLQYLDDYYDALRDHTDAAIEVAEALTRYNIELVRYEKAKGTLLEFFAVDYCGDPCRQAKRLRKSDVLRCPVQVGAMPRDNRIPAFAPELGVPTSQSPTPLPDLSIPPLPTQPPTRLPPTAAPTRLPPVSPSRN